MKLREVKRLVSELNYQQLINLDAWLHRLIEAASHAGKRKPRRYSASDKTYRSELVRCGKKGCKCANGQLHGPYWYAYWTEGGKTKSQYVGKQLPRGVRQSSKR